MATLVETVDEVVAAHPFALVLPGGRECLIALPASRSAPWLSAARIRSEEEIGRWVGLADLGRVLPTMRAMVEASPSWPDHEVARLFVHDAAAGRICAVTARDRREFQLPRPFERLPARFTLPAATGAVSSGSLRASGQADMWAPFIEIWLDDYADMPGASRDIVEFSDHGYRFLFDVEASRTVVAFGTSVPKAGPRDGGRMSGFLGKDPNDSASEPWRGRFLRLYKGRYDRGHFMSHGQGGGLDANLFPQRADVNQGHSEAGKAYRAMEKLAADNPGTHCFSRPVYCDDSWVPLVLDYGLIHPDGRFQAQRFPNRY